MHETKRMSSAVPLLLAGTIACGGWAVRSNAQSKSAPAPAAPAAAATPRPQPARIDKHAVAYYASVWGIEDPTVKWAEAGELIRFSYRIIDPEKAKTLNDKALEPSLIDPEAHVKLVVPSLENVGALRQSGPRRAGKVYWMAFSNSGRPVRRGHHVDVVIGNFHAVGLIVE